MPPYLSQFHFKVNGAAVSGQFYTDLIAAEAETNLHLPGMFTIELHNSFDPSAGSFPWSEDSTLAIGAEVEISAVAASATTQTPVVIFKGEITSLEPRFEQDGACTFTIRGYDKSHRLHRKRHNRTFLQMTDSDVASSVAGGAGLAVVTDSTSEVHPWVLQDNITDYEFLVQRARRVGHVVYYQDGQLHFKKPVTSGSPAATLKYMETLTEFHPRFTSVGQASTVHVRGWDPKTKAEILGQATSATAQSSPGLNKNGRTAAATFSPTAVVETGVAVTSTAEANLLAQSLLNEIAGSDVQGEGVAFGVPALKAGVIVTLQNLGRFSGNYLVASARHSYTANGYETSFTVVGSGSETVQGLLLSGAGASTHEGGGHPGSPGVVTAIVTNVTDNENKCRVKVKYPWMGDSIETDWVRVASPMAGPSRGLLLLPEVNDEVLIAFEHGDLTRPYVIGALWNGKDAPPITDAASGGAVNKRILKTRAGHQVILDDTSGAEKISIIDKTNGNSIVIDSANNVITVTSAKDVTVKGSGNVKVEATGNVDVTASGNATMKGVNVTVEGSGPLKLKGATVTVEGTGMVEIKGPMVKIN